MKNALQFGKETANLVFMFTVYDSALPNLYTLTYEFKKQLNNLLTFIH